MRKRGSAIRARGVAAALMIGLIAPAAASGPPRATGPQVLVRSVSLDLEIWMTAVRSHVPGRNDAAIARVAPWPRRTLDRLLDEAAELPFVDAPLRKRGAVLHADVAAAHRTEHGYSLPSDGRTLDVVQDGNLVGTRGGTVHWETGRRLLALAAADEDVLIWYRATSAFLQEWRDYSELEAHLAAARSRFPEDAVLLLYEGALHASYAQPRIQRLVEQDRSQRKRRDIGTSDEELREAERRFARAFELDPDLVEARIRLACVRGQLGRHAAAADELRRSVAGDLARPLRYFAWLLLGREEAALGRSGAARQAFERAVALYPGAQCPRLGLSLLARGEGDKAGALAVLAPLADAITDDPWWSFETVHAPNAEDLLVAMRRRLAP